MGFWLLLTLLVSGCGGADGPVKHRTLAVQGMMSGALSEDGSAALVGSLHHGGHYWDMQRSERIYDWNHQAGTATLLQAVALSANGQRAVTASEQDLVVWNASNGQSLGFWRLPARILSLALSPDGRYALAGLRSNQAVYVDLSTGMTLQSLEHQGPVHGVALSDDGKWALTGSDDKTMRVWALSNGAQRYRFDESNLVRTVAIDAKGEWAYSSAQRESPSLWNLQTGKRVRHLDLNREHITRARFSADGSQLLLGSFLGDLYLLDRDTGKIRKRWKIASPDPWGAGASQALLDLAFVKGGGYSALVSDGTWQLFR